MRFKLLVLVFMLLPLLSLAQQRNQEATLVLYNVGFGGITAGIGAAINKPKGTPVPKAFIKGFWQGCIGGALQYTGKRLTYQISRQESCAYAWPAKIVHAAGASIVESAALNRPFGRYWNIDVGPVRFDYAFGERQPFKARFNAMILFDIYMASQEGAWDWKTSLQTGTLAFRSADLIPTQQGYNAAGRSYTRAFVYCFDESQYYGNEEKREQREIVAHELVHGFQYKEYLVFNTWLNPLTQKFSPQVKNIFQNYVYVELPYFSGFYWLQGRHGITSYYKNFYEFEAEHMASGRYVYIPR